MSGIRNPKSHIIMYRKLLLVSVFSFFTKLFLPVGIAQPIGREKCVLELIPYASSCSFGLNESVIWSAGIANNTNKPLVGKIIIEIETYSGKNIAKQEKPAEINAKETRIICEFSFNDLPAGFYHIKVCFEDKKGLRIRERSGFAVAPETLLIASHAPDDLDSFWLRTRVELSSVPLQEKLTLLSAYSSDSVNVYLVELHSLGNVRIRGYYAQPRNKIGLPAILHFQGYSSVMEPFGLRADVAQFFINIRGHGNSRDDIDPGFPGYFITGITDPENYIYRGAYADALRSVDFLAQRPEIDTARIAVMGASQGGALSFATAALDKRIALCASDVPFLSDFRNYFQIAHWPANEVNTYCSMHFKSKEDIFKTLDYFDVSHLTPRITCPVFMGVGLYDDVCPPAINFAAYNNLSSTDKNYLLYPKSGHALPAEQYDMRMNWIRARFGF